MPNTKDVIRSHYSIQDKEALMTRMRRIEGQAKGIGKMIEKDRYCIDIVQQINALSSAADEVGLAILKTILKAV